jgi:hypothetical protein
VAKILEHIAQPFRGPGSFQVKHGEGVPDEQPGIYLDAVNGDIVIRAA